MDILKFDKDSIREDWLEEFKQSIIDIDDALIERNPKVLKVIAKREDDFIKKFKEVKLKFNERFYHFFD